MRRCSWVLVTVAVGLSACATMSPEEWALRDLMWDAATRCASGTGTISVTDIDIYGRVWYSVRGGGKNEVPTFEACYSERSRAALAKRPDLAEWLKKQRPK